MSAPRSSLPVPRALFLHSQSSHPAPYTFFTPLPPRIIAVAPQNARTSRFHHPPKFPFSAPAAHSRHPSFPPFGENSLFSPPFPLLIIYFILQNIQTPQPFYDPSGKAGAHHHTPIFFGLKNIPIEVINHIKCLTWTHISSLFIYLHHVGKKERTGDAGGEIMASRLKDHARMILLLWETAMFVNNKEKASLAFMRLIALLLVLLGAVSALRPCQPFGTRIFYGEIVLNGKSGDKLHIYFNTAEECAHSYVQTLTKQGLDKVSCEITALRLSEAVNFYTTFVHKCRISRVALGESFNYNVFGWDGGSANPVAFSDSFIPVTMFDVTDSSKKTNLIVLADWSFLETTRYTSIDQLLATTIRQNDVHGMLINGDLAYDLITNNCKKYEQFIIMLSKTARSLPVILATGNHEYASDENFELYRQSFEMYGIDQRFAAGLQVGSAFLAPFDPFITVYRDEGTSDPALQGLREALRQAAIGDRFIVSSSHYPMACSGPDQNCVSLPIKLKQFWESMFEHRVRLYFGAHDHSYQRTLPMFRNGSFSQIKDNYTTEEDYIVSLVEGVAGNDEGMVESIDELKDITVSYTVNETGFGLLEVDTEKAKYSHFSTKRGKTDQFVINRTPTKRNLMRN